MQYISFVVILFSLLTTGYITNAEELICKPLRYNDIIEKAVAEVSEDSLRSYVTTLQNFTSRKTTSDCNKDTVVPWIHERFIQFGVDSAYRQQVVVEYGDNVVAIIAGQNNNLEKYCLIGGSMDAVLMQPPAAGANDNASGVAAVLEAARVLAKFQFQNTIRFITFNAQEVGQRGSAAYATAAANNSEEIIGGLINYRMIGYTRDTATLNVLCNPDINGNTEFAQSFKTIADTYVTFNVVVSTESDILSVGDHVPFWNNGYAALLGCDSRYKADLCPNDHIPGDLLDDSGGLNDSELMANCTRAAVAVLAELAVTVPTDIVHNNHYYDNMSNVYVVKNASGAPAICFTVMKDNVPISVMILNLHGKHILTVTNKEYNRGTYSLLLPNALKSNGVYFVKYKIGSDTALQRCIYLK